jgi:hypothetical protein
MTYSGANELSTPCDKVLFSGNMHIGQRLHEVEECSLGFAEVGSHFVEK